MGALICAAATAAIAAVASPAMAGEVKAAASFHATRVTAPGPAAAAARLTINPLRVRDPQQYARQKAAADARYQQWRAAHPLASLGDSSPALTIAPTLVLNKPGMGYTVDTCSSGGVLLKGCNTPPDTTGAIGPNFYLEFVNSHVAVYNRATLASVANTTEDAFTGSKSTCDGQIKWDQKANRWVYWSLDCAATAGANGFSFGWSKTSDPSNLSTGWCKWHFNTTTALEDYGKLGNYDGAWIVGANEFPDAGGSNVTVIGIQKPAAGSTACGTSVPNAVFHPSRTTNFTPVPAALFGSSTAGYIVARDGVTPSTHLRMLRMTGTTAATYALFQDASITVPSYNVPPSLPQPGSTNKVDTSDARNTQAAAATDPALAKFGIWTQHTIASGSGSIVRWYELKDGQTTPVQRGDITAGTGGFAFNGAISPTTDGNAAAVNYDSATPTTKITLRSRIHAPGAAAGVTSNPMLLGSSGGIVNDFSCPSHTGSTRPCRWGDYAGASFDPSNHLAVWGTGELVTAPDTTSGFFLARWLTRNFEVTVQ